MHRRDSQSIPKFNVCTKPLFSHKAQRDIRDSTVPVRLYHSLAEVNGMVGMKHCHGAVCFLALLKHSCHLETCTIRCTPAVLPSSFVDDVTWDLWV